MRTSALVVTWPNVGWRVGYSAMFVGRSYESTTDANGLAILEDLKPGTAQADLWARIGLP